MSNVISKIQTLIEDRRFRNFILTVIVFNSILLGLETSETILSSYGWFLYGADRICLAIFVVEIMLKLIVYRLGFFKSGWNCFDVVIVGISLLPSSGTFTILRALRVFRALRLFSSIPAMRRVVAGLIEALPGVASAAGLLTIVFYVGAVLGTNLFGPDFPDWFGTIGKSLFTLFQVMTLESWSMGIARPVMEAYPYAWLFFVPFILASTFTILNVFIGVIVDAMSHISINAAGESTPSVEEMTLTEVEKINQRLDGIEAMLRELDRKS